MKEQQPDLKHMILGEIHHLLSISTPETLLAASKECKSEYLREALRSLAKELSPDSGPRPKVSQSPKTRLGSQGSSKPKSPQIPVTTQDVRQVRSVLEASPYLANRAEAISFAAEYGLEMPSDAKANRKRILAHFAKQILALPSKERERILKGVGKNGDGQTAGWMDVLRRR